METQKSSLDPRAVVSGLQRAGHSLPLFFFGNTDSTMDEARKHLKRGIVPPFIIAAGRQHKGRGRMGRTWYGEDSGNFYFTFVFSFTSEVDNLLHLTLWFGEILARYCQEALGLPVYVKLPNDLYSGGKKLAGMLIESIEYQGSAVAFGLGLNVNSDKEAWPEDLRKQVISLAELNGEPLPFNRLATAIAGLVIESYKHFLNCKDANLLDPHAFVKERLQVWPKSLSLK